MTNKSIWGLDENIAATLAYVGLFFTGIVVYILEKENKVVRFHALQSTIVFFAYFLLKSVLSMLAIPLLSTVIIFGLDVAAAVAWIYMMWTTYQGKTFKIPVIGNVIWDQVNK